MRLRTSTRPAGCGWNGASQSRTDAASVTSPPSTCFGNAATRIEAHLVKGGIFSYGSYPDIDELYRQQAIELVRAKREALLFKIQQLVVERTIYAPIWQLAFINAVGPRVGESGFARIPLFPYTSPYEDITLKRA